MFSPQFDLVYALHITWRGETFMLEQILRRGPAAQLLRIDAAGTTESGRVGNRRSMEDPDAALVHELRSGSATAFDDLVKRYQGRLLKVAIRITKNREDAEDVVQEAFLNVFRHLDRFRGDSRFASWLTRITINQALMQIRRKTRTFVSIDRDAEGTATLEIEAPGYTPEQLCAQREFEGAVVSLAMNVRESCRQALELNIEKELSEVEIARLLRLSLSAVKARLHRGKKDLRKALSGRLTAAKRAQVRSIESIATVGARNHEEAQAMKYLLPPSSIVCTQGSEIHTAF